MRLVRAWVVGACLLAHAWPAGALFACGGDCDGSGDVTVDEIVTAINIALSGAGIEACVAGDRNEDGEITVDEILLLVNNALSSCVPPVVETWVESDFALVSSTCPTVVADAIEEEVAGESSCAIEVASDGRRVQTRDCDGVVATGTIGSDGVARFSTSTAEQVEDCLISIALEFRVDLAISPTTGGYLAAVDLTGTCPFGGCAVVIESTLTRE